MKKILVLSLIISLCAQFSFAEEQKQGTTQTQISTGVALATTNSTPVVKQELDTEKIYDLYNKAVCEILVIKILEDGSEDYGSGTGFFINDTGYVATCFHLFQDIFKNGYVVRNNKKIGIKSFEIKVVIPHTHKIYDVLNVVGINPYADSTLLSLSLSAKDGDYTHVTIGDSEKLKTGEKVFVIGSPLNLRNRLTTGMVSKLALSNVFNGYLNENMELELHAFRGNSGSPVFNKYGEVVAIIQGIHPYGSNSISYAVPTKYALIENLKNGNIAIPSFGVTLQNLPVTYIEESASTRSIGVVSGVTGEKDVKKLLGIYEILKQVGSNGIIITELKVFEFMGNTICPAKSFGLEIGDVIIQADKKPVTSKANLGLILLDKKVGDEVELKIIRHENGHQLEKTVRVSFGMIEPF